MILGEQLSPGGTCCMRFDIGRLRLANGRERKGSDGGSPGEQEARIGSQEADGLICWKEYTSCKTPLK